MADLPGPNQSDSSQTLHIHQLPNELLATIFIFAEPESTTWSKPAYWLVLMAVCRRWRDIICTTAEFWRIFDVLCHKGCHKESYREWLALCLERSGMAPVHVRFRWWSWNEAMEALAPHSGRVLSLDQMLPPYSDDVWPFLVTPTVPMPVLKQLVLHAKRLGAIPFPVFLLLGGWLPVLETLDLTDMKFRATASALKTLRSLTLRYGTDSPYSDNPAEFRHVLAACVSLETLTLIRAATHTIGYDEMDPERPGPVVTLPNIREVSITDVWTNVRRLLAYLHVPAHVHLKLFDCAPPYAHGLVRRAEGLLPKEEHRDQLPILRCITRLQINIRVDPRRADGGATHVVFRGVVDEGPSAGGTFELAIDSDFGHTMSRFYTREFFTRIAHEWFPCGSSVKSLMCVGDIEGLGGARGWEETLRPYPNLQTLTVDDSGLGGFIGPLLQALGKAPAENAADEGPLCPKLEYLRVRNAAMEWDTEEKILNCIESRTIMGLPLQTLRLELGCFTRSKQGRVLQEGLEQTHTSEQQYRLELASLKIDVQFRLFDGASKAQVDEMLTELPFM